MKKIEFSQQISDFKKIVEQIDIDRFDVVAKSVLNGAGRQESAGIQNPTSTESCPREPSTRNQARPQISNASVPCDRQFSAKPKEPVEGHRTHSENKLRRQREEIYGVKNSNETVESRLRKKQKSLENLANSLEQQRLAQKAEAEQQSEKLLRQQQESLKQLEASVRESEDRLERKRKTLHKLASVVKARRRAQKDSFGKQMASSRSRKLQLKREARNLRLKKKHHRTETRKQKAELDQNRAAMLAESKILQQQKQEMEEQRSSLKLQRKNELSQLTDQDAVANQMQHDEMQLELLSKLRSLRLKKTKLHRGYNWLLNHFARSKNSAQDLWQ